MDLSNRNSFGSVRRLRDRFEQTINNNNNSESVDDRNCHKTNGFSHNCDQKLKISPKPRIIDKSFAEKLNKTLNCDKNNVKNNSIRIPNLKPESVRSDVNDCPMEGQQQSRAVELEVDHRPNPLPKPPRTFAHDMYIELKFGKAKEPVAEKSVPVYSVPNKANKTKYRNRSQSDSRVNDDKKSTEFHSTENIYDDIRIKHKTLDKTFKSYILKHFPCIRPDLH